MAVFLMNTCKFNSCGMTFSTLGDLIQHIEDTHLESDPRVLEKQELQQPPSLPLSYVLRLFCDAGGKREMVGGAADLLKKRNSRATSPAASIRSVTPTGSELDDDEINSDDEDSDDSWTTQEEFSSEVILSMMANIKDVGDKPFACPVPGCKKRYKNVNGIKYHARHGHRKDARFVVKKAFKCKCGKSYRTAQGLRNHQLLHHPTVNTALIKSTSNNSTTQAVIATATNVTQLVTQPTIALSIPAVSLPTLPQTLVTTMAAPLSVTMTTDNHPNISNNAVKNLAGLTAIAGTAGQTSSSSLANANHIQAHVQAAHALAHAQAQAKQVAQAIQNATNNANSLAMASNLDNSNTTPPTITNLVQSVSSAIEQMVAE